MNKVFYLNSLFKSATQEDGSVIIEGMASTESVDRVGDIVSAQAWTKSGGLANYKKNPIILFNHQYGKPIGKAIEVQTTSQGLYIKAKISKASGEIGELIKDGVLGAFSVGMRVKDAEYVKATDGFLIKDVELFEVSVVSIPANQDAVFSLAKSFETVEEFEEFKKTFSTGLESDGEAANAAPAKTPAPNDATIVAPKEIVKMDPKELEALLASVAAQTAKSMNDAQIAREEAARLAAITAANKVAEDTALNEKISVAVVTGAERLVADIEKRFADKNSDLEKIVNDLKNDIAEKSSEIVKMRDSKRLFADRTGGSEWKKEFGAQMDDAYVLSLVTKKNWAETKYGKDLLEKVNSHSGVIVSSADFEQIVSTNIERDIQNELVLAPLFRTIQMNAASMILPILPDAGYAEFSAAAGAGTGISTTVGNLDPRSPATGQSTNYGSAYSGVTLTERILTTKKLVSRSYIGNETEEDAILPILPLIRESMVRSHARAIESSLLVGNAADGPFGVAGASYDGLIKLAIDDSHRQFMNGNVATAVMTAAQLLGIRKKMGKYGVRAEDVVYIVSQNSYFELLEDVEFQDMNLVGNQATKINGQVGQVFGSKVIICDEFKNATNSIYTAVAVYTRNYLRPVLRGLTVESDYLVESQKRVLVASQRVGFIDLMDGVTSKWALNVPAT